MSVNSISSQSKVTLLWIGELEGKTEDSKNRKVKQQGVLPTCDRKGREHAISMRHQKNANQYAAK